MEMGLYNNNDGTSVSLFMLWGTVGDGCRARWHSGDNFLRDELRWLSESGALRRWQHCGNRLVRTVGCVGCLSSIRPVLCDGTVARRTTSIPFVRPRRNGVAFVMIAVVPRGRGDGTAV